jgi:prevent-host-death family protein
MDISVSDARATLPDLLDRVAQGEEITITRHGHPAAVLVRPDAIRRRQVSDVFEFAAWIGRGMDEAASRPLGEGVEIPFLAEWISEIRAARDARS